MWEMKEVEEEVRVNVEDKGSGGRCESKCGR